MQVAKPSQKPKNLCYLCHSESHEIKDCPLRGEAPNGKHIKISGLVLNINEHGYTTVALENGSIIHGKVQYPKVIRPYNKIDLYVKNVQRTGRDPHFGFFYGAEVLTCK
jgi:hypothetical protein